jgi:hypothetical protein
MGAVGKLGQGAVACFAASLVLLAIPVGLSYAEAPAPAPSAAACPPSPAVLAGSAAPSSTPAAATPSPLSASMSPYRPSAEEVVACVGSQEINGATFTHWAIIAENAALPAHRPPAMGPPKAVMVATMGFLISADWLIGEAANLHIEPSTAEVRHLFDRLRHQQFPKPAQFKKFLKHTSETVSDLLLRVRLSILTIRIQQRVEGHGSKRSRRRAFTRFLKRFQRHWQAQTYCETLYRVHGCGHTAGSL